MIKKKRQINTSKKKEISERAIKLYKDWLSTKGITTIREMTALLKEGSKAGGSKKLVECAKEMGPDGQNLIKMFQESWDLFGDTPPKAKIKFMKILEAESRTVKINTDDKGSAVHSIETSYFPISDRSNQMYSVESPNDRDLVVQIRNAVTGGNMEIAKSLITSGWGSISLKERMGLIEWVNNVGNYNVSFEGEDYTAPAQSKNTLTMKQIEKRSDIAKSDFADQFVRTAQENMKLQ